MAIRLTKNFYAYEMLCPCGCGEGDMDPYHMAKLQKLRDAVGEGLVVTSAIRCKQYNKGIDGAARHSWHIPRNGVCYACDITFAKGPKTNQRILYLAVMAEQQHFKGMGLYPRRIHVDNRPGRRARWINRGWNWNDY